MFVGYGSIILPGVTIGNKVIVGAGTVCSKNIPDNSVVVGGGTSYRVLCTYDEYVERQKKRMEILPISNICFKDKTKRDWDEWLKQLEKSGSGFDL